MTATKAAQPPQLASPRTDELAEARTMRGLWFGLMIAFPCWLVIAMLLVVVF